MFKLSQLAVIPKHYTYYANILEKGQLHRSTTKIHFKFVFKRSHFKLHLRKVLLNEDFDLSLSTVGN